MMAYQALKNDPKEGSTVTLFSWMIKCFIIFLEIVPVVAKIFLSPPSVYAARIRAEVERENLRSLHAEPQTAAVPAAESDPSITEDADAAPPSSGPLSRPHAVPQYERSDVAEVPMRRPLDSDRESEPPEANAGQLPSLSAQTIEFSPSLDRLLEERLANGKSS
jgi:hypothetical protein